MNNDVSSLTSDFETAATARAGSVIWMLALQFFLVQAIVQSAWTSPFSLKSNFISDLGNTVCAQYPPDSISYVCSPWHAWMNGSFIVLGLSILSGGWLLRHTFPSGRLRPFGLALLALAGTGIILVGLFPENVNHTFHRLGAAGHFVSGNLAIIVFGLALASAGQRKTLNIFSIVSGVAGLLATALFITDHYCGLGIGGMERVAAYPLPLWLIVSGVSSLRRKPLSGV